MRPTDARAGPEIPFKLHYADPVGTIIAERYRVLSHLNDGGMASVYLAEHVAVGRQLALKILHPDQALQPDVVRRFLAEARAASLIRHANIVDIIDVGFTPEGQVYMAMELLEGEDLGTLLERDGPLPWQRLGPMLVQVCDALGAAHAHEIIHRDVKPENCFRIRFAGAEDFIKLLDFGIAKDLGGKLDGGRNRTQTGSIYGTAAYVAPESLSGKTADARVDIYALGVLTYELLLGKKPFVSETLSGLLLGHLQTPPTPLHELIPDRVSPEVDAIVLRCLAKDPDLRFQTMAEVSAAITATLDPGAMKQAAEAGRIPTSVYLAVTRHTAAHPVVRASPIGPGLRARLAALGERLPARVRRHRRLAAAALAALVLLPLALWLARPGEPPRVDAPELPPLAARREPAPPAALLKPAPTPGAPELISSIEPVPLATRPTRLTEAAARQQIDRLIVPRARACLKTHTNLIKGQQFPVTVTILPSGEARSTATLAASPAARCIAELFKRHRFAPSASGLSLRFSFTP
ncbi:MAG: serine/threonine protein kinase [Myxococcales bacterium]|nr:serine/threonine protein kinase [Myxococcales bacterium]